MTQDKFIDFLTFDYLAIAEMPADSPPKWGSMSLQEMVEHLIFIIELTEKTSQAPADYNHEKKQKSRDYILSDEAMPQNFQARFVPEKPNLKFKNLRESVEILQTKVRAHGELIKGNNQRGYYHPIFGMLDANLQYRLHNKHFTHHLTQFGIIETRG